MAASSTLPPEWRRVYATIKSLQLACPNCGAMAVPDSGAHQMPQFDPRTALFACRGCRGRWYVGVVLWPARGRSAVPEDHTPTPREAADLRAAMAPSGEITDARVAGTRGDGSDLGRRRARVNLACSCGEPCAVHQPYAPRPVREEE